MALTLSDLQKQGKTITLKKSSQGDGGITIQDLQKQGKTITKKTTPPLQKVGTLREPPMQPSETSVDVAKGFWKGLGRSALDLVKGTQKVGGIMPSLIGVGPIGIKTPELKTPDILQPKNTAQKVGGYAETAAEFLLPLSETKVGQKVLSAGRELIPSLEDITTKVGSMVKGKSLEKILSTAEEDVYKLSPAERKVYFDAQKQGVEEASKKASEKILQEQTTKMGSIQTEAENLNKELQTASRDEVLRLRPKITESLGRQSQEYRKLVAEELSGKENLVVKTTELNTYIDSRFPENPDLAQQVKLRLGTAEKVAPLSGTEDALTKVKPETTIGKIFEQSKALKQEISAGARVGKKVYTADDKLTDDAISTLNSYLKENGVDLKNANQFWSKYAPIRDQLVSEAKPFIQSGTQTKTFASTLQRVAQGKDVNNENFIKESEKLVGPIGENIKSVITKLNTNQKLKIATEIETQSRKLAVDMAKEESLKKLSQKAFETERQARLRDMIKNIIKYVVPGVLIEETVRRF